MPNKFGLLKDRAGRFYFNLTGEDGTELMRGMPYFTMSHAARAAREARQLLLDETHLVRFETHGKHCFVLRNDRGELVARSLHVRGPLALQEIVQEAMLAAPRAIVVDTTQLSRASFG